MMSYGSVPNKDGFSVNVDGKLESSKNASNF